jgi:8-oxo-dGTP pyrophosphatase MutT (NUDIX family)
MKGERPKVIPTVYLVLLKGGKILLLRRFNTGFWDGWYSLPAGHLCGDDETLVQALVREAWEEVGIEVNSADLELVHVMHRKQTEPTDERRINVFFRALRWRGEPRIMEPEKCDDLGWFELDYLPDNVIPYVRLVIECLRKGVRYSEHGF